MNSPLATQTSQSKLIVRFITLFLVALLAGCSTKRLPLELQTALREANSLQLHSLDPTPTSRDRKGPFQGWQDLGSTDVSATAVRTQLLDAFDNGIADSDGSVAMCFNPRHGLRAIYDGKTYDVVICFECLQGIWFVDDVEMPGFLLTGTPQTVFDTILTDASIPLAPSEFH